MERLKSYISGGWQDGKGQAQRLVNPSTEEVLADTCAEGLALDAGVAFARKHGGAALRALDFAARGKLLGEMARILHEHRAELLELAMRNGGNTRSDAKFDVDGAAATLAHYAELGAELGAARVLVDGDSIQLGRSPRLAGRHVWVPRRGVALLINAFNFPAWGFGEKAACALLAGMPVIVKPATSTALVAHRIVELVADAVPAGVVSLVCGSAHELPSLLEYGDVIAFTGSSDTARRLAALDAVQRSAVRLNVEADSLNAAVLGPDVEDGSDTFDLFLRDVTREMTQKTGQKCTAIRRIFVPLSSSSRVCEALAERLEGTLYGDVFADGVRMGPLATAQQHRDVMAGIGRLAEGARMVLGSSEVEPVGTDGKGFFVAPTLFESADASLGVVHELEVFGPVATVLAAPEEPEALGELLARGGGGLVTSVYTDDRRWAEGFMLAAAPHHGRLVFGSKKIAELAISPGTVMPQLLHGGPGRAGGGEELGGLRGLALYCQRTALQGARPMLDAMVGKV
jgi:oxepin-CoA hydrolase/3-oxo-5,6-dehydrosuberyl-CoA semialdehyde dehydrogenase